MLSEEGVPMFRVLWRVLQKGWVLGALVTYTSLAVFLLYRGSANAGRIRQQERAILYQSPEGCFPDKSDDLVVLRIGTLLTNFTFGETECVDLPRWLGERASTCCLADTSKCNAGVIISAIPSTCTTTHTLQ